jgi:hypothetical protein
MKQLFKKYEKKTLNERLRQPISRQPTASFSYYSSRRSEQTPRYENESKWYRWQKETLKLWGNATVLVALVLTLVAVLYGGTLSQEPKLTVTPSDYMTYRQKQQYTDEIKNALSQDIFSSIKLTFRKKQLTDQIYRLFPETKSVAITIPIVGRRPLVDIVLYRPVAVLSTSTKSYIIDESGRVIIDAEASAQNNSLPRISDLSGLPIVVGAPYIPSEELTFIDQFNKQLQSKGVSVSRVELPAIAKEVHFYVGDNTPVLVKASLVGDPRMEAGSTIALLKEIQAGRVAKPSEYIDVRVEDRVFYK